MLTLKVLLFILEIILKQRLRLDTILNVTTEALSSKKDMTINSDNYNRTDRRTELGTAILSDSHVNYCL